MKADGIDCRDDSATSKIIAYKNGNPVRLSAVADTVDDAENTRLAAWAGIFAVATAFAGIWGMNFSHMPELEWRYGYPFGIAVIAGTSAFLWWRFRKAKWL